MHRRLPHNEPTVILLVVAGMLLAMVFFLQGPAQAAGDLPPTPGLEATTQTAGGLEILETQMLLSTAQSSVEITPTATLPSPTPVNAPSSLFLPAVFHQSPPKPPIPAEKAMFCFLPSTAIAIPDGNDKKLSTQLVIQDTRRIADLDVLLRVNHTGVGDLSVTLVHEPSALAITLLDRPGRPEKTSGCSEDNLRVIFDDWASLDAEERCSASPAAIAGIYRPAENLSTYWGQVISGTWTLQVGDHSSGSTGVLKKWCLAPELSPNPAKPTPTPILPSLPAQKIINGVSGKAQALPLDCESRSAVDWASVFGTRIPELEFYYNLPHSDHPDEGFVGNVNGTWGQIPPDPYGVHAQPVASLLRAYGLNAYAHRGLSWPALQAEIAAGRPVIAWIIGSWEGPLANGIPAYYKANDPDRTIVARYEHTVVVTGYTQSSVYYLNGASIYSISITKFLESWSALGNMAITASP